MSKKNNTADTEMEHIPPKFELEILRSKCVSLFGVSTATFDGATEGLTGKYSVEEINTKITNWLKKPIKGGK